MLIQFKNGNFNVIKYYKTLVIIFTSLGTGLILFDIFGPSFEGESFLSGTGTGLLLVSCVLFILLLVVGKKEQVKEDLELSFQDERLQIQRLKMFTISHFIAMFSLIIMVTVSVYYEFSFSTGGTILLLIQGISLLGLKLYYRNK